MRLKCDLCSRNRVTFLCSHPVIFVTLFWSPPTPEDNACFYPLVANFGCPLVLSGSVVQRTFIQKCSPKIWVTWLWHWTKTLHWNTMSLTSPWKPFIWYLKRTSFGQRQKTVKWQSLAHTELWKHLILASVSQLSVSCNTSHSKLRITEPPEEAHCCEMNSVGCDRLSLSLN